MIFRFGSYALDAERRELTRSGKRAALERQVFDILLYFLESRHRVVTRDDVLRAVWRGRLVSESTLSSRITAVRQAIGDSGARQQLIRTVTRSGYRFVGAVTVTINRPAQHRARQVLAEGRHRAEPSPPERRGRPGAPPQGVARTS